MSLETFRKTGVGVNTPIWFAELGGEFLLRTDVNSGKVKRIRNNSQVMVAPCNRMGNITGEWVAARATIDETPEAVERVQTLLFGPRRAAVEMTSSIPHRLDGNGFR